VVPPEFFDDHALSIVGRTEQKSVRRSYAPGPIAKQTLEAVEHLLRLAVANPPLSTFQEINPRCIVEISRCLDFRLQLSLILYHCDHHLIAGYRVVTEIGSSASICSE
jgi:hypothetical protein